MNTLENLVKQLENGDNVMSVMKGMKKIMVTSDYHIPYIDKKAFNTMISYAKKYKPDEFIINGDFLDFYSLSFFDKNPDRRDDVNEDLIAGVEYLNIIRKAVGKKCKIVFLEGNHDYRLQRYLWKNRELKNLKCLELHNLLNFKKYNIKYVRGDMDYWKNDNGHYSVGDVIIMHGDNRMNGASTSQYSGYSVKNTVQKLNTSICMGHVHRGAIHYHTSPYKSNVGMECGCLCSHTGTANWQQGFITFETRKNSSFNHKFHIINKGIIIEDGKIYK